MTFEQWWHEVGSGLPPLANEDREMHVMRVAKLAAKAERQACWDEINSFIKQGPLPGNGCDESAQRNGLVLATNIIMGRLERSNAALTCAADSTTGNGAA